MKVEAPADWVMSMLTHRFGNPARSRGIRGLAEFQADAVARLSDILAIRRGAILADSVGLGKTLVARALIAQASEEGERILVCTPAQLALHWKRHLRGVDRWHWLSHTRASRSGCMRMPTPDFIVVDEAHGFRNPRSRRYRNLQAMCVDARVLLLTATPINNSLLDFYHLLRLFAAENTFQDAGVPDLLGAFRAADASAARRVAELVMVRRTREMVETASLGDGLRFPRCAPMQLLRYDLDDAYPDVLPALLHGIGELRFPAHSVGGQPAAPELMRIGLLKRLESSAVAFTASLEHYESLLSHFIGAGEAGLLFDPARDRALYTRVQRTVQLPIEHLALAPWPVRVDRHEVTTRARLERDAIREMLVVLRGTNRDPKLDRLASLLDTELADQTVLLFTEFRETALHLWSVLAKRGGVGLIHGGDARLGLGRASRRIVIERFAPIANGVRPPKAHQRVRLLIATDVLAEG